MKTLTLLSVAILVTPAVAQQGPPPGGPPPSGGMRTPPLGNSAPNASSAGTTTETLRILTLNAVQKDLGVTAAQIKGLAAVWESLSRTAATEDATLAAVGKVLTTAQVGRLQELLVQDMGYRSLEIAAVRAQLSLTADQTKAMDAVLANLQTTRLALANASPAAQSASAGVQSQTADILAKLLTPDQDTKLHGLSGRALGTPLPSGGERQG